MKSTTNQLETAGLNAIKNELEFQRSKGNDAKVAGLEWALKRLTAEKYPNEATRKAVGWTKYDYQTALEACRAYKDCHIRLRQLGLQEEADKMQLQEENWREEYERLANAL